MDFFWIYNIPNWLFLLITLFTFLIFSLGGYFLMRKFIRKKTRLEPSGNDTVNYFLSAIGMFYGISLGLIAVGTWENFSSVDDSISKEAASVAALYKDVYSFPKPYNSRLKEQLKAYTRYTIDTGWALQQKGIVPAGGRLVSFQDTLYSFTPANEREKIIFAEAISQFNKMVESRRIRLQNVSTGLPMMVWIVIILGAIISIVVTWFFVVENQRLYMIMLSMYSILIASLIFLIASMDYPFMGDFSVSPGAFELVYSQVMNV